MEENNSDKTENSEQQVPQQEVKEKKPLLKISKPKIDFDFKAIPARLMGILREYRRVIIVSKKPDIEELSKISKVAGIGIIIVGLIGFFIQIIFQLLVRGV